MENFRQISTKLWPLIYVIKIFCAFVLNQIYVAGYHACLQRFCFSINSMYFFQSTLPWKLISQFPVSAT